MAKVKGRIPRPVVHRNCHQLSLVSPAAKLIRLNAITGMNRLSNSACQPFTSVQRSILAACRAATKRSTNGRPNCRASAKPNEAPSMAPVQVTAVPPYLPQIMPLAQAKSSAGKGMNVWITINKTDAATPHMPQDWMVVTKLSTVRSRDSQTAATASAINAAAMASATQKR